MPTVAVRIGKEKYEYEMDGGEGGIRTPDRLCTYNGFRDRRIQPLCHLSVPE